MEEERGTRKRYKPFAYHATREERIGSILNEGGILPSRGIYGRAVYTKTNPLKTLYPHYGNPNVIFSLRIRRGQRPYTLPHKRDWIMLERKVDLSDIYAMILFDEDGEIENPQFEKTDYFVDGIRVYYLKGRRDQIVEDHYLSRLINQEMYNLYLTIYAKGNHNYRKVEVPVRRGVIRIK